MAALPNIGGALCSTPQSVADAQYWSAVHNDAKTRNPLKLAGVPQTTGPISATSGPKLCLHHIVETCGGDIALSMFFSIVDTSLVAKI